jgi:hypothetical protein
LAKLPTSSARAGAAIRIPAATSLQTLGIGSHPPQ